jgi:glycosidase
MSFATNILHQPRPESIRRNVSLPVRRSEYFPSPIDWRDEVLYFLLVDRFSDGGEDSRPKLDLSRIEDARTRPGGVPWRWDEWAESGAHRWQGGTLRGVQSKLGYLRDLGITALWLSPVFKQRVQLDTFHGYGVQDFLDVDPRLGTRDDLVELVSTAHDNGIRIILDIIFNHTGANWVYPGDVREPPFRPFPGFYPFGRWIDAAEQPVDMIRGDDDGGWPRELQDGDRYTRAGKGDLGSGDIGDSHAEHKRTDFFSLRDLRLDVPSMLSDLAQIYKYWIALTDCDGIRIDTLKHVSLEEARNFNGAIREFGANIGKLNFFQAGEVAGGDPFQDFYLDGLSRNLSAVLDIGGMRPILENVSKGLVHPRTYFDAFNALDPGMGSHRNVGNRHVTLFADHDHVSGEKVRYSTDAASAYQAVAAVAIELFTLGIPMIYYGSEQGFAAPEPSERRFLPGFRGGDFADRYLREAMFGPVHARKPGRAGFPGAGNGLDENLPGFGPFGSTGHHCFDPSHPAYVRFAALSAVRRAFPALRHGRQYLREFRLPDRPFAVHGPGEVIPWARILDEEEALVVVNSHGTQARGGHIVVDRDLSPAGSTMTVIANTAQVGARGSFGGSHPIGSTVLVRQGPSGVAFVDIANLPPSEVLVLTNRPVADEGGLRP